MNKIKDIRIFIIKEIFNSDSCWSRTFENIYSNKYITIKKDFDTSEWVFKIGNLNFYEFKEIGINKFFLAILLFVINRRITKLVNIRKDEKLLNEWHVFLKNNKDINRDIKIEKIIKN